MDNEGFAYRYIKKKTRCDICCHNKNDFFSCNICVFFVCPTCFNKIYFYETSNAHNATNICSKNNI